jgi:quercetin dioxygenase-like cupin family protein
MRPHRWNDITTEQMSAGIARQVIHAERMTVARIFLSKGAVVPRHSHDNEQVTLLQEGKLKFLFDDGQQVLSAGEVMQIPPDAPHRVEALEDSVAIDLFAPPRLDWIRGDDAYLRG